MTEQDIRTIVQDEIQKQNEVNQFDINLPPIHSHSLTDSSGGQIPISSIIESVSIPGIAGGVFNTSILNTQKVNNEYVTLLPNPQTVYTIPINIIYGFGGMGGTHSAFEGGTAENGTMIFFENTDFSSLWIYTANGWRGVNFPLSV